MQKRLRFEIHWESRLGSWADDLGAILSRVPRAAGGAWPQQALSPGVAYAWRPSLGRTRGLILSLFVHACGFAFAAHASLVARAAPTAVAEVRGDAPPIYLDLQALRELRILRALPVVTPAGRGGTPGPPARAKSGRPQPTLPDVPPASTVQNPKFTIVVNPLRPENPRQAIRQFMTPPDLKIKVDQQLPDIILNDEQAPAPPKPEVDLKMRQPTAHDPALEAKAVPAPSVAPNLPAPVLPMNMSPAVAQPKMPASYFTSDSLNAPHQSQPAAPNKSASADPPADGADGIIVLSAQPSAFSQLTALAQGNRQGALSIAPSKPGLGSPGGEPSTSTATGGGGEGTGGDASAGVGPGNLGGGGGPHLSASGSLSAVGGSGKSGGVDVYGLLGPVLPSTVYPVTIAPKLRHAPLVISAGPIGGGGLDVYGALTCGKVYSIFLPMPGKNWALQYCPHEAGIAPSKTSSPPSVGVVHMEAGIVPPYPEQQFDFRRLPVPDKDGDKLIILQGMIGADGAVSSVRVFRGVLPEMDAEAAQAFANWKFKPATRASVQVALDVLVGIPARPPESTKASPEVSTAR